MSHIILLGDSIFDNAAYTDGEPDVVHHLRDLLPPPAKATLLAVDGSLAASVPEQLRRLPRDATHLVISAGGNDALGHSALLVEPVQSVAEAFGLFADPVRKFTASYRRSIDAAVARGKPVLVCTIYEGNIATEEGWLAIADAARLALSLFNDVIVRTALEHNLPIIDLRSVCTEPADYANPIEPSGQGGKKIARAIVRAVGVPAARPSRPRRRR